MGKVVPRSVDLRHHNHGLVRFWAIPCQAKVSNFRLQVAVQKDVCAFDIAVNERLPIEETRVEKVESPGNPFGNGPSLRPVEGGRVVLKGNNKVGAVATAFRAPTSAPLPLSIFLSFLMRSVKVFAP